MTHLKKKLSGLFFKVFDLITVPITLLASCVFKFYRKKGIGQFPVTTKIVDTMGVYPLYDHYYDPLIAPQKHIDQQSLKVKRTLNINFHIDRQLALLASFSYQEELACLPYQYGNSSFEWGDAEFYYSLIRQIKPKKIIEIGSGNSTKIALLAIEKNRAEDPQHLPASLFCIEPYEAPWLEEEKAINTIRKKVEEIDPSFFRTLEAGDILFIDSSHMIRPGGDVLYNILHLMNNLDPGVYIHVHDIFTPYDYPYNWICKYRYFWNEQYLLEALLTDNDRLQIIASLNYLSHDYPDSLAAAFPIYQKHKGCDLGSFWMKTIAKAKTFQ